MAKWWLAVPPVVFFGLVGALYLGLERPGAGILPSVFVDKAAPAVGSGVLPGIPGFTDADLRGGQVTIVNFWASWCPPCRAEHPTLKALSGEGIRVMGVNMMDDPDKAIAFLEEDGNPFLGVIADPKGRMRMDWGVTAPPETFILRGDGTVAYRFIGPMVGDDYEQRFRPELEKALRGE